MCTEPSSPWLIFQPKYSVGWPSRLIVYLLFNVLGNSVMSSWCVDTTRKSLVLSPMSYIAVCLVFCGRSMGPVGSVCTCAGLTVSEHIVGNNIPRKGCRIGFCVVFRLCFYACMIRQIEDVA